MSEEPSEPEDYWHASGAEPGEPPDDWEPDDDTLAELEYRRHAPDDWELDDDEIAWLQSSVTPLPAGDKSNPGRQSAAKAAADVVVEPSATKREQQLADARDVKLERMRADNKRRTTLFRFAIGATGAPVVISSLVIGWLVLHGRETEIMIAAYFGSVVIQVVGLAVIIAKNLFPEAGDNGQLPTE